MKDLFNNDGFWFAFIAITIVATITLGVTVDTYLDKKENASKIKEGLQECLVSFPGEKSKILWQKKCSQGRLYLQPKNSEDSKKKDKI